MVAGVCLPLNMKYYEFLSIYLKQSGLICDQISGVGDDMSFAVYLLKNPKPKEMQQHYYIAGTVQKILPVYTQSIISYIILVKYIPSFSNFVFSDESRDYCQWESLNATCDPNHVILMHKARYGRMQLGRCVTSDYHIGCHADVLLSADR